MDDNNELKQLQRSNAVSNLLVNVKKRDFTYDDILETMNLKVVDGNLQYIHPQNKKINTNISPIISENIVPPSKEEQEKRMRENLQRRKEEFIRLRQQHSKSTKLLFTNNLNTPVSPSIRSSTHFLKFVKIKPK